MNKKTKIIAASAATVAMCSSLVIGGTYALFTSEDSVNVAVTSGNVKVTATVDETSLKTYSWYETSTGERVYGETENLTFTNDEDGDPTTKSVALKDGKLIINKMTPTDKVTFNLRIKNESDVKIQYQTVIKKVSSETDLFDALTVTVGTTEFDGVDAYSAWNPLAPNSEDIIVPIEIEFPDAEDNNDYQGMATEISYSVKAVQGNAYVVNPYDPTADEVYISTAAELFRFASDVNGVAAYSLRSAPVGNTFAGKKVFLGADIDLGGAEWTPIGTASNPFKGTFDGQGFTVSNFKVNQSQAAGFFGWVINKSISNLNVVNATINGNHYVGGIAGYLYGSIDNCTVTDSEVIATVEMTSNGWDNGDKVGGIVGYVGEDAGYAITNNKVENTKVAGFRDIGGIVGCYRSATTTVSGNAVVGETKLAYTSAYGAVVDNNVNVRLGAIAGRDNSAADKMPSAELATTNSVATEVEVAETPDASVPVTEYEIYTQADLFNFATEVNNGTNFDGKTFKLMNDITLTKDWIPAGTSENGKKFAGVFDGQGHTIYNMTIISAEPEYRAVGFIGAMQDDESELINITFDNAKVVHIIKSDANANGVAVAVGTTAYGGYIENVTVKNSTVVGNRCVSAIVGYMSGVVTDCTVSNTTITANPDNAYFGGDNYDNGDKAGIFVGVTNGGNHSIVNNTATNVTVKGYRDVGGIAGYVHSGNDFANNTVDGLTLVWDGVNGYKNYATFAEHDVNALIGESGLDSIPTTNKATNVTYQFDVNADNWEMAVAAYAAIDKAYTVVFNFAQDGVYVKDKISVSSATSKLVLKQAEGVSATFDGQIFCSGTVEVYDITFSNEHATTSGISKAASNAIYLQGDGSSVYCEGVTFEVKKATAITSWWSSGENGTTVTVIDCVFNAYGNRPLQIEDNATIIGCTFNDAYRYAAQLTCSGTAEKPVQIVFKNNTLTQATTSGKPTYGLQFTSDYGNAYIVIEAEGNVIVDADADDALYVWEEGTGVSNGFVDIDTITLNAKDGEFKKI